VSSQALSVYTLQYATLCTHSELMWFASTTTACSTLQIPTADSSRLLKDQLPDLKRMCCSTDYMFAYSQELLRVLEERSAAGDTFVLPGGESQQQQHPGDKAPQKAAKAKASTTTAGTTAGNGHTEHNSSTSSTSDKQQQQPSEFSLMCARKFRRLRQELASHALDGAPAVAAASAAHSAAAASASATAAPQGAPPRGEAVCLLGGYRSQHYSDSNSSSSSSSSSSHKRKRDIADAALTTSTTASSSGDGDTDGGESPDAAASDAPQAVAAALVTERWPAVRTALQTALGHATGRQPVALPAEAVLTLLRCYQLEPLAVSTNS
jgi:hypothetical protein